MQITRRIVPAAILAAALSSPCHGQTNPPATSVPPIVVTATRMHQTPEEIPSQVTVISAEQIRESGSQSVVDALRDLGGVYVRTLNGNPAQAEVSLRGFGENSHGRVLVLRDGLRLNSPDLAGVNWLQIPLGSIQRVEVLKGGNSVLYGDHAVGGVINIVTHEGADAPPELSAYGGSYGTYAGRASYGTSQGGSHVNASADWQTSDGFRRNGDYDAFSLRTRVMQDWNEDVRTSVAIQYDDLENGLPGYLSKEQMDDDPRQTMTPDDHVETGNWAANLGLGYQTGAESQFDANLILNRKDVDNVIPSWSTFVESETDSLMFTPRLTFDNDLFGRRNRVLTGVDLFWDNLEADRFAEALGGTKTLSADLTKSSAGAYLQNEHEIAPGWTLGLGGRGEQARYDADVDAAGSPVDDSKNHFASALSSSLLYRPNEGSKLFGRAATLYRFPFIDEQVSYYGYGADRFYQDLDPETGLDLEIGGSTLLARGWQAELTLFQLTMKDEIGYNPVTTSSDNMDDTRRLGAETGLSWQRPDLGGAGLFYTFVDASFTDGPHDGSDVPLVPKHTVTLNGQAELPLDLTAIATARYVSSQVLGGDYENVAPELSDYIVLDVALRYTPARVKDLSVLVGVDNVLDKQYANVAYLGFTETGYYPAPDRTWKTAVSYRF